MNILVVTKCHMIIFVTVFQLINIDYTYFLL